MYLEDLVSFSVMIDKWSHNPISMKKPGRSHSLHFIAHHRQAVIINMKTNITCCSQR